MRKLIEWIVAFLKALFGYPRTPEPPPMPVVATLIPPVYAKSSILTRPETFFFYSLIRAVDGGYAVFAKVRMGDVLYLANEPTDAKKHKNNIQCKHFDFVLCERQFYRPLLVIELDDKSHQWPDSLERDRLKDSICEMADLPMLRVELTGRVIDSSALRNLIDEKLASVPQVDSTHVIDDATPDDIPFSD